MKIKKIKFFNHNWPYLLIVGVLIASAIGILFYTQQQGFKEVTTGTINLRSGPGITYDIVTQVKQEERYRVIKEENNWEYILLDNNQAGWIPNWRTNAQSTGGFIATVLNDHVTVYEESNDASQSVGTANKNDKYNILYQQNGFVQVQFDDNVGWLKQSDIEITPGKLSNNNVSTPTDEEQKKINDFLKNYQFKVISKASGAQLHSSASADSSVVYKAKLNEELAYLGLEGAYYHVKAVDGTEGYLANWLASSNAKDMENKAESLRSTSTLSGRTIVIDPGHGGRDPGAVSGDHYEKTVTLKTALATKKLLESHGVNVILTRSDDTFVDLGPRAEIANNAHADAFISFHYDMFEDQTISGTTLYYYNDNSLTLVNDLQAQLIEQLPLPNNGARFGDLQVLRDSTMPATLIELGYMSNPNDIATFTQDSYYDEVAQAVYDGLTVYFQ